MNSGYLSFLMIVMLCVLLATGWKDGLLGNMRGRSIFICLGAWIGGLFIVIRIHPLIEVSGAYVVLLALTLLLLIRTSSLAQCVHLFTSAMLVGSIFVLLHFFTQMDARWTLFNPILDVSIIVAICIVLLVRTAAAQFITVTLGLSLGEGLLLILRGAATPLMFGSLSYFDCWWFTLACIRLLDMILKILVPSWRTAQH